MSKIKISINNLMFYSFIFIMSLNIYRIDSIYTDFKVLFSNLIIIVLSILFMTYGDRYNYSLNKIFMLFSFFFFGIAPAIQYQKGVILWSNRYYSSEDYFKQNVIIIIIILIYQFSYSIFTKLKINRLEKPTFNKDKTYKKGSSKKLLILAIISLIITLYVYNFKISRLFLRGSSTVISKKSVALIFSNFIRPIPVICLLIFKSNNSKEKITEVLLWIIILITNFPTSSARFYIASLYIAIMIIYSKKIDEKYLFLNKIIIGGLLFIFPLLDQVRRINNLSEMTLSLDFIMFSQGHFDSYQMFMYVVVENIITYGRQLVTALLFFVPRAIWQGKSLGSGSLIAEKYNFSFSNISMNFFGEGYINFGYLGILLFVLFISYFNARYDKLYWEKLSDNSILRIFYLLSLGLQIFLLRGDMLSGTAFITGMFVSLVSVSKFTNVKK